MTSGVAIAHLDDVPTLPFGTDAEPDWKPLRHHLGVGAFGVNAWVAARAGDPAVERHDEAPAEGEGPGHQELYVVLRGAARFTVDGQDIDAPTGTLVFIEDPALMREAVATGDDTVVLAIGAARGVVFEPSDWEQGWLQKLGAA